MKLVFIYQYSCRQH